MNERIKELAKQAGAVEAKDITNIPSALSLNGGEIEDFAELIVRECIDKAFHNGHPDLEFLLKHFGVEE